MQNILDIGTGPGTWAIDVADKFPEGWWHSARCAFSWCLTLYQVTVNGVDLYPPPNSWVPPNCFLEVEDVLQDWTWKHEFDLIHMRLLLGAFTDSQWDDVYHRCYE